MSRNTNTKISVSEDVTYTLNFIGRNEEKDFNEIRATFIVKKDTLRKLKYIAWHDRKFQKDVLDEALSDFICIWERRNGNAKISNDE